MSARVGVAGLGLMGSGIASRMEQRGNLVGVYNRTQSKARAFAKSAFIAKFPMELAGKCDYVITCVTNFGALSDLLFKKGEGLADCDRKGLIVIDCSTILPEQSEYCAKALRAKGIEMLGSPVMGGPAAAASGELVAIVSGKRAIYTKALKVLKIMGKQVFYAGNSDGQANAIKLALNLNIALIAGALSEAITLMKGYGADPSLFLKVLNTTYFRTGMSEKKGPKMVKGDFEPSFHLKNMLKDVELACDLARSAEITIPLTNQAAQLYRAANNSGYSELDYTALCGFLQQVNGISKWKTR